MDELSLKLREIEEQQNGLDDSVFEIGQSKDNALCNSDVVTIEKVNIEFNFISSYLGQKSKKKNKIVFSLLFSNIEGRNQRRSS